MELDMSSYFHRLERLLDCPKTACQPFLDQTRRMATDFIQGNPNATTNEVAEFLGDPQELAQGFLETLDPKIVEHHRKRKKYLGWTGVAILAILLVCISAWCIYLWKQPSMVDSTDVITIYSEFTEES